MRQKNNVALYTFFGVFYVYPNIELKFVHKKYIKEQIISTLYIIGSFVVPTQTTLWSVYSNANQINFSIELLD